MTNKEFTAIVEETKPIVLTAVRRYLFKSFYEFIDDVVQETYYKAYRHLVSGKFRGDAKISSWLYCIARNESNRYNSKLMKDQKVLDKFVDDISDEDNQDNYLVEKQILNKLIDSLSDEKKKVFELFVQHFSLFEIAQTLSLNENTVKTIIYRTKKEFVKQMMIENQKE